MKTKYQHLCLTVAMVVSFIVPTRAADQNQQTAPPTLKIIHFNVGNGDATFVVVERGSTKRTLLIDGGNWEMAGKVVIPGIQQEIPAGWIDYAIATQYDAEHRDGLVRVVRSLGMSGLGVVYDRDRTWPYTAKSSTDEEKVQERPLQPGSRIPLDPLSPSSADSRVVIECVAANGNTKGWRWTTQDPPLDENAESLAFLITFGKFRYFIGGDLTGGGRSGWNATPNIESAVSSDVGQVSVLRVNHHGSRTSTNQVFLSGLNPNVAIISTGHDRNDDQNYPWPSREVLDRLDALPHLGAVYITGEVNTPKGLTPDDKKKVRSNQGNISITTTGQGTFKVNETSYSL